MSITISRKGELTDMVGLILGKHASVVNRVFFSDLDGDTSGKCQLRFHYPKEVDIMFSYQDFVNTTYEEFLELMIHECYHAVTIYTSFVFEDKPNEKQFCEYMEMSACVSSMMAMNCIKHAKALEKQYNSLIVKKGEKKK